MSATAEPQVTRPMIPLPPLELCQRVGSPDLDNFELIGQMIREEIVELLPSDWDFAGRRILDFGCGAGRVLRQFLPEAELAEFWGCDIDGPSIAWVQANMSPPIHVFAVSELPVISIPDGFFDLIFAYSVFTHLPDTWAEWLIELRRVLRPGGMLVATFLGPGTHALLDQMEVRRPAEDEIGMAVLHSGASWDQGGPFVFHSPWWIAKHWGRAFEVLSIRPSGCASPKNTSEGHGLAVLRKDERDPTPADLEAFEGQDGRETIALLANISLLRDETAALRAALQARIADNDVLESSLGSVQRQLVAAQGAASALAQEMTTAHVAEIRALQDDLTSLRGGNYQLKACLGVVRGSRAHRLSRPANELRRALRSALSRLAPGPLSEG